MSYLTGNTSYYPFQLTTSTRRSTVLTSNPPQYPHISTHDLHTEVDSIQQSAIRGGDISTHDLHTEVDGCTKSRASGLVEISTHDLHTEVDAEGHGECRILEMHFNSRPPHGGRHAVCKSCME